MALAAGTRIGSYEIVSPLGAGGMGEVYRARDPRLNRDVALKVLPDAFADDPERLARFEREAQALAALKHPHIAGDAKTTLYSVPADGSGGAPEPAGPEGHFHPHGWSADGELVAVRMSNNSGDLVRVAPQPGATVHDVVATPQMEGFAGSVSPDGRWLAYTADPTGRNEIWVRPVSGAGAAVRLSPTGGTEPIWSRDGRELFYVEDRRVMAVAVTLGAEFNFKAPQELFTAAAFADGTQANIVRGQQPPSYDIGPDGRLVMITVDDRADVPISVIVNWAELLRGSATEH